MESFKQIRSRLTLLYTGVLTGLAVIIVGIMYTALYLESEVSSAQTLRFSAVQLANAFEIGSKDQQDTTNLDSITEALNDNGTVYTIWNDDFTVVKSTDTNQILGEDKSLYLIKKYFATESSNGEITDFDVGTESYKVCTDAYVGSTGKLIMVQLIKNMSAQRQVFQGPLLAVVLVVIVSIGLSIGVGNFLATRALKPIRKTYEQQRDFLADASHELRTPVAVVLTNLEVVKAHKDSTVESQMNWVDNAYSEIKRTKAVVEDLLLLAKADAGERIEEFKPVDLSYLTLEVTESLESLAKQKGLSLNVDIQETDLFVMGDSKRLAELLIIIIENAIKYTNKGGRVLVYVHSNESRVIVEVIDNGIGISEEEQEKVFERFYRVDKTRSRKEGGTGLGLSIAKWIVKEHRANITLNSKEGEGSTFILSFNRLMDYFPDEEL